MRKSYNPKTIKVSARLEEEKLRRLEQIYGDIGITAILKSLIDEKLGIKSEKEDTGKKLKLPIIRIGGKYRLADQIIEMIPREYKVYVEVFAGAGHVILRKPKKGIEVLNDKYLEIYNLFKVTQSRPLDLQRKIIEMPNSRKFYEELKKTRATYTDEVDKAAIYVYLSRYSYYGDIRAGFRISTKQNIPLLMKNIAEDIERVSERLSNVIIECKDYKYILKKYDSKDTIFFCDPPYLIDNNEDGIYEHKFNRADMVELIKRLKNLQGKFMFIHYENEFLNGMFEGWTNKVEIETFKGSGAIRNGCKPKVKEVIWYNYDL